MEITKRSELQRKIKDAVEEDADMDLPLTLTYCEGFGFNKYEITIKMLEADTFIDSRGVKWVKARDQE